MAQNVIDKSRCIAEWLMHQTNSLALGLRSVADAERLYDWFKDPARNLPEFADEADQVYARIAALGYEPMTPKIMTLGEMEAADPMVFSNERNR